MAPALGEWPQKSNAFDRQLSSALSSDAHHSRPIVAALLIQYRRQVEPLRPSLVTGGSQSLLTVDFSGKVVWTVDQGGWDTGMSFSGFA